MAINPGDREKYDEPEPHIKILFFLMQCIVLCILCVCIIYSAFCDHIFHVILLHSLLSQVCVSHNYSHGQRL